MQTIRQLVEWIALAIELLATIVIVAAIIAAVWPHSGLRTPVAMSRRDLFSSYKQRMGRGLLLGLELLLAADIVSTVALKPTLQSLAALGLLAIIRTFLSWSLDVEIDGCWPWRARPAAGVVENEQDRHRGEAITRE
jgi:uncharacterized membrane protein